MTRRWMVEQFEPGGSRPLNVQLEIDRLDLVKSLWPSLAGQAVGGAAAYARPPGWPGSDPDHFSQKGSRPPLAGPRINHKHISRLESTTITSSDSVRRRRQAWATWAQKPLDWASLST